MRPISHAILILLGLVGVVSAHAAAPESRFDGDEITPAQWEDFRSEVLAKPGLERQEFANQLVLFSNEEHRIYVFTQPQHPAHPAVVVRAIVPRGTGSELKRMGHYAGDKAAFDKWWHEFDALDARMRGPASVARRRSAGSTRSRTASWAGPWPRCARTTVWSC